MGMHVADWVVCVLLLWCFLSTYLVLINLVPMCPWNWSSDSKHFPIGSCWNIAGDNSRCTPSLAIDAIIEYGDEFVSNNENLKIILVHRRDPPRDLFATPGGYVEIGETVEAATIREVKEETNLDIVKLEQFGVYSDPRRDKRRHTVSSVFRCLVSDISKLKVGDDAKSVKIISLKDILSLEFAFDHRLILQDYMRRFHPQIQRIPRPVSI